MFNAQLVLWLLLVLNVLLGFILHGRDKGKYKAQVIFIENLILALLYYFAFGY